MNVAWVAEEGELQRTLQSLACGKARILYKNPKVPSMCDSVNFSAIQVPQYYRSYVQCGKNTPRVCICRRARMWRRVISLCSPATSEINTSGSRLIRFK
jgi:hypothetical protein